MFLFHNGQNGTFRLVLWKMMNPLRIPIFKRCTRKLGHLVSRTGTTLIIGRGWWKLISDKLDIECWNNILGEEWKEIVIKRETAWKAARCSLVSFECRTCSSKFFAVRGRDTFPFVSFQRPSAQSSKMFAQLSVYPGFSRSFGRRQGFDSHPCLPILDVVYFSFKWGRRRSSASRRSSCCRTSRCREAFSCLRRWRSWWPRPCDRIGHRDQS